MLVKMKKSERGSPNGIKVVYYQAEQEYDIPESLYDVFVNKMKIAESVDPAQEEKMVTPPSNKAVETESNKKDKKKDKKKKDEDEDKEKPFDGDEFY